MGKHVLGKARAAIFYSCCSDLNVLQDTNVAQKFDSKASFPCHTRFASITLSNTVPSSECQPQAKWFSRWNRYSVNTIIRVKTYSAKHINKTTAYMPYSRLSSISVLASQHKYLGKNCQFKN